MLVYATSADYLAWTGGTTPPENISQVLRSASLAVRESTELCFYATDSTGIPTDADKLQAFNDATCCQAAALVALDMDPLAGGTVQADVESGSSIGSAHITFSAADAANAAAAKARLLTGLTPDAARILRNAGVTPTAPWVVG